MIRQGQTKLQYHRKDGIWIREPEVTRFTIGRLKNHSATFPIKKSIREGTGIRTQGSFTTLIFKINALNHSAMPPLLSLASPIGHNIDETITPNVVEYQLHWYTLKI